MQGILLMNFGGPATNEPAAIEQYIYNILADPVNWPWGWARPIQEPIARRIAKRRAAAVAEQYAAMGGGSPLMQWSTRQRDLLVHALAAERAVPLRSAARAAFTVYLGMQYWPPFIEETLATIAATPITDLLLLPLYPHSSSTTSDACCARALAWWQRHGRPEVRLHRIESWYTDPCYVEACAGLLAETLEKFREPAKTHVLFTAHGLPQAIVDRGDIYPHQVLDQIHLLRSHAGVTNPWTLGFQSRLGPVRWIEPSVETCLHTLAARGVRSLCLMPVSFVADQLETLYEIDVTYMNEARALGIREVHRVPVVNDNPRFIACLKKLALQ